MRMKAMAVVAVLALSACGPRAGTDNAAGAADALAETALPADFATLPMKDLMGHVLQYSADNVWKWQGYTSDATGEHSLFPKTDEEWLEAESAALTLAEITNILLLPGRAVDDPQWAKFTADVRAKALAAAKTAEAKNEDAFFLAGSDLYEACKACHVKFAPNYQQPPDMTVNGQTNMN
jgi:hypothetical protein